VYGLNTDRLTGNPIRFAAMGGGVVGQRNELERLGPSLKVAQAHPQCPIEDSPQHLVFRRLPRLPVGELIELAVVDAGPIQKFARSADRCRRGGYLCRECAGSQ
jgi:hypothetical protein